MFGAAVPGQEGKGHINCQPHDYWHAKFGDRGYDMFDAIRPLIADDARVSPWYRNNMFLYRAAGMIVDFDDFCEGDHQLDLLQTLREANPLFRCTLFAIPALGSDDVLGVGAGLVRARRPRLGTPAPATKRRSGRTRRRWTCS